MKIGVHLRVKNEDNILADWIKHYLALGFDRILLVDNMSDTPVEHTLKSAGLENLPQLRITKDEGGFWRNGKFYHVNTQCIVWNKIISENHDLDWLFFCDADEFLWCSSSSNILTVKSWLATYPDDVATVVVNWLCFGMGGATSYDRRRPIVSQFTRREPYDFEWNVNVKSFIRPRLIKKGEVHISYNPTYKVANVYGHIISAEHLAKTNWVSLRDPNFSDSTPVVLVHYLTLDAESMARKHLRNTAGLFYEGNPDLQNRYTTEWYCREGFSDAIVDYRMLTATQRIYNIGIILAAGNSTRYGGELKQIALIENKPAILYSIEAMISVVNKVIVVTNTKCLNQISQIIGHNEKVILVINDDVSSRIQSIRIAFDWIALHMGSAVSRVICHDAARPFITTQYITDLLSATETASYAQYYMHLTNGLAFIDADKVTFVDRNKYVEVCTPFCIEYELGAAILRDNPTNLYEFLPYMGPHIPYKFIEGKAKYLRKITTPDDL